MNFSHTAFGLELSGNPNRTDDALFSIDDPKIPAMSGSDPEVQGSAEAAKNAVPTNHE
ncbi:MAG: hypothetical protein U0936_10625 [Planctomycetaceae bacterium]